jgi:6-pyruvoyltetrahydropterin/6-carboxytetrahydropterin synthase
MIATVVESFVFDAAHHLPWVPVGHKCGRKHGHTWRVELHVTGTVDPRTGMVIDYYDIHAAAKPVIDELDHHDLNDVIPIPTTENIAAWLWCRLSPALPGLSLVVVFEGATSRCEYRGQA